MSRLLTPGLAGSSSLLWSSVGRTCHSVAGKKVWICLEIQNTGELAAVDIVEVKPWTGAPAKDVERTVKEALSKKRETRSTGFPDADATRPWYKEVYSNVVH